MAFSLFDLWLVRRLKTQGYLPADCRVIEIGAQQVDHSIIESKGDLEALGALFGITEPPPSLIMGEVGYHRLVGAPPARDIWRWLGIEYAAIDIDGSPGAIPLDLNVDFIPEEALGKYHLVTNFGTTEHVANQANAFKIIHDLAAPEG